MSEKEMLDEENKHKDAEEQSKLELKPCPFCGGKAFWDSEFSGVYCHCGAEITFCESDKEAAEKWNSRPIEYALKEENKRLHEALAEIKKTIEYAQDTVYPLHIALDSKDGLYILEVVKEALESKEE